MAVAMGLVRRATSADHPRLGEIAAEVFAIYGKDYGVMIPAYARDVRVLTLVYEEAGTPIGFIQVGFIERSTRSKKLVADILAVGVAPLYQGQGVGAALFARAFEVLEPMRRRGTVEDVQLTVADTNGRATELFRRLGFCVQNLDYGNYEGGQRAIRMGLIPPPDAQADRADPPSIRRRRARRRPSS